MCRACHRARQKSIRAKPEQLAKHAARERAYRERKKLMNTTRNAVRQGDVLVLPCNRIPANVTKVVDPRGVILAEGEATGHFHGIRLNDQVALFREDGAGGGLFLSVSGNAPAELQHQEHSTLLVPPGAYKVIRQRVWSAGMARRVAD
jgi:hypothetical protein